MRGLLPGCLVLLVACSSEKAPSSDGEATALGEVTFHEDVAPILFEQCVSCHYPGSVAPFSLTDYASAKQHAAAIVLHTGDRHMPPMPVDNSGACNTYSNARWLSDEEIATLAAWVEQGSLEGDPAAAPPVPQPPEGLGSADVTLDPGAPYSPNAALPDDYRCFVLPAPVQQDAYVTAYEVIPGEPRVVHHLIVYQPSDEDEAAAADALDAEDAGQGYSCFGGPRVDAEPLVIWAPGAGVVRQPEGTGTLLTGGRRLIMQVHYNLGAGSFPDRSRVLLDLENSVPTVGGYRAIADTDMVLAPGQPLVETQRTFDINGMSITVYGVLPHMHTLGRTLRVDALADGGHSCLVHVDRWNFHWQNAWWYSEPKRFARVDTATIRCGFDTSGRTEPVTWGQGTLDEMCLTYLYLSAP